MATNSNISDPVERIENKLEQLAAIIALFPKECVEAVKAQMVLAATVSKGIEPDGEYTPNEAAVLMDLKPSYVLELLRKKELQGGKDKSKRNDPKAPWVVLGKDMLAWLKKRRPKYSGEDAT